MPAPIYTVGPGRLILRDGLPAFYVELIAPDARIDLAGITAEGGIHGGSLTPTEADGMAHMVADLLTEHARRAYLEYVNPPGQTAWVIEQSDEGTNGPIAVNLVGAPGLDAQVIIRKEIPPGLFNRCIQQLIDVFKPISPDEMKSARHNRRAITRPIRLPRKRTH